MQEIIPFYKKLNLDLDANDWRFLNYLSHTYLDKVAALEQPENINKNNVYYTDVDNQKPHVSYAHFFLKNSSADYRNNGIFKKIAALFKTGTSLSSFENIYQRSQISRVDGKLLPHKDKRKSVITIPVVTLTAPVFWYKATTLEFDKKMFLTENDSYLAIESYDYKHTATLINTAKFHGSPDNLSRRIFFQVGLAESFEEIVDSLV